MGAGNGSGIFLLAAVLSAVFMGTIGTISLYAGVSAETVTFYRLFIGAILVGVLLLVSGQKHRILVWPGLRVLITGVFLAGFVVFYVMSMNHIPMATAVMLIYLAPVTASVVAHFFMGERLSAAAVGLIGFALCGFAMMMEFRFDLSGREGEALGFFYGLCAMFCYAAFILINRLIEERIHVLTRSGYQMLAGALCMLPLMLQQGDSISGSQWGWLLAAGCRCGARIPGHRICGHCAAESARSNLRYPGLSGAHYGGGAGLGTVWPDSDSAAVVRMCADHGLRCGHGYAVTATGEGCRSGTAAGRLSRGAGG